MSDDLSDDGDMIKASALRVSRPTLAQVKTLVAYMERYPDLATRKHGTNIGPIRSKKLWVELSNILNSMNGAVKSTKGWIKFWADKRRSLDVKKRRILQGKTHLEISPLEQKILDLCGDKISLLRRKKIVKQEPCNGDEDELVELLPETGDYNELNDNRLHSNESDDRHLNMIEKMVAVMDQQSSALTQMAQASLVNSKAMERIAEAANIQALAVDRLVGTFETISASVQDVRNAILGIDYTMKRCYPPTTSQERQNPNLFS